MSDFQNRVAVVTGSASGIGFALAERFAAEGMRIVLADVERRALEKAKTRLEASGAEVLAVETDVGDAEQMDVLAEKTLERFGTVHLVCNNAGVGLAGPLWEFGIRDWEFVLNCNLWGVIHGIRVFVPHLVAQNEGYVVNTASMAALMSIAGAGPYTASKQAVAGITETLYQDLKKVAPGVGVSLLCPGFTRTRSFDSERNRPENRNRARESAAKSPSAAIFEQGMAPEEVARQTWQAILERRFYVLTHAGALDPVRARADAIIVGLAPAAATPTVGVDVHEALVAEWAAGRADSADRSSSDDLRS